MIHEQYPELKRLFSCILNEVWELDHPSADAALQAGIADLWPNQLQTACEEMDRLRADSRDTATRTAMIHQELGANYVWELDGYTLDDWLAHVASMLNQRQGSKDASEGLDEQER